MADPKKDIECETNFSSVGGNNFLYAEVVNITSEILRISQLEFQQNEDTSDIISASRLSADPLIISSPIIPIKDCLLKPHEKFGYLFVITVKEVQIKEQDQHLKLLIHYFRNSQPTTVQTFFHYPVKLKIRRPLFALIALTKPIHFVGERFDVTYVLINNLQDFIVDLKWKPKKNNTSEDDRLICHNPGTNVKRCERNTHTFITVSFSILNKGIAELVEPMQVSLSYMNQEIDDLFKEHRDEEFMVKRIRQKISESGLGHIIYRDIEEQEYNQQKAQDIISRVQVDKLKGVKLTMGKLCEQPCQVLFLSSN